MYKTFKVAHRNIWNIWTLGPPSLERLPSPRQLWNSILSSSTRPRMNTNAPPSPLCPSRPRRSGSTQSGGWSWLSCSSLWWGCSSRAFGSAQNCSESSRNSPCSLRQITPTRCYRGRKGTAQFWMKEKHTLVTLRKTSPMLVRIMTATNANDKMWARSSVVWISSRWWGPASRQEGYVVQQLQKWKK